MKRFLLFISFIVAITSQTQAAQKTVSTAEVRSKLLENPVVLQRLNASRKSLDKNFWRNILGQELLRDPQVQEFLKTRDEKLDQFIIALDARIEELRSKRN